MIFIEGNNFMHIAAAAELALAHSFLSVNVTIQHIFHCVALYGCNGT